ncbi:MAG: tetratricopeptide repeat protein, partial [Flavobacteriales bacterium]|nr:tetratricopeptide repeat protein [Flavobacteriales bacterium]
FRRLGDDRRTAFELKNAGTIYEYSGDYDSAEDFHNEALEMQREMNDQKGIMSTCQRLGAIKMSREHYKAATNYFKTSLDIAIQLNNHYQAGMIQQYIAQTEERQKHYELAVAEYLAAEQYFVQANTPQKIYLSYFNIARTYLKQGNYGQAESFIDKCIALTEEGIAVSLMANIYNMQGLIQSKSGNLALAVQSFNKSIQSATESGDLVHMATTYQDLSNTYSLASDFKGALTAYKTFSTLKDSLFNEDKSKEIGKLEAKHEFDTAELERKRVEREQLKRKVAEQSRRDNLQYSGILIFLVLLFAGLFMLGRISIPLWLAEGMIFFSFLLFFEFTLVLLDPLIEDYSLGAPAIKLGLNSILAALIFPLHAFFEERIKTRLSN